MLKLETSGLEFDSSTPIIDRDQIEMLLGDDGDDGDLGLVIELFEMFCDEIDEKLSELDEACKNNESNELRKIVHYIGGSAGNLGMFRLSVYYRAIENSIDANELVDLSKYHSSLHDVYKEAREAYQKEIKALS